MDDLDRVTQKALFRFQVISAYLAADPPRGQRSQTLRDLAAKTWMLPSVEMLTLKAETIRYWLRRYRTRGFEALKDKPRSDIGIRAIPREPLNEAFKQRIGFAHNLRTFTLEDTRNYIRFHLERVEGPRELFTDEAVQILFNLAQGLPRVINQIALQALNRAAIRKADKIDENFLKQHILNWGFGSVILQSGRKL